MENVEAVVAALETVKSEIAKLTALKTKLETDLETAFKVDITDQLKGKDYGTGTVNVTTPSYKVKFVISKKVEWDQDKLISLYNTIALGNENPTEYIDVSYAVKEERFKNWPTPIKSQFEPARTVKISKPSISVERKE